ncbi:MAG: retroviral-like aspartic protease family protein [Proteobacteria bacterium]|nr:retroviral-like aspartic protease family protein [Pseudomonadota bacterium]
MEEQPTPENSQGIGKVMVICAWILAILMMTLFFSHWSKENHMNTKAKLVNVNGNLETLITRNAHNQYMVDGMINGQKVVFLLDTGATAVVIPGKIAKELNLKYGPQATANTAGGNVDVYQTWIDELVIGNIMLNHVSANINPAMNDDEILLGMSALRRLSFYQQGDNLVITTKKKEEDSE